MRPLLRRKEPAGNNTLIHIKVRRVVCQKSPITELILVLTAVEVDDIVMVGIGYDAIGIITLFP